MTSASMRLYWLVAGLLLCLYMLVYLNYPPSIDGAATLAVTQNLLTHGTPTIEMLGASETLLAELSRMGSFGSDGGLYSKKGITPSLALIPLVAVADFLPGIGVRALAMWFNPLVTLATALLLLRAGVMLGYKPVHSACVALLFGAGTMALAYTQTLFGEPLAALCLLAAFVLILAHRTRRGYWRLGLAGCALGLTLGINYSYVLLMPFYGLFVIGLNPRRWAQNWRETLSAGVALGLPVIVCGLALLAYNAVRYGSAFTSGYQFDAGEGFNYPFGWGMFGQWLSPYRGLLWYNPPLLLALWGFIRLWKHQRGVTAFILVLALVQTAAYAAWWSWHGGIVWGARFLLPVLPLLMLGVLAGLEFALRRRLLLAVLIGVALAVQMLGTLIPYEAYYAVLYRDYGTWVPGGLVSYLADEVLYTPGLSPLAGHMRLLLDGSAWQIALTVNRDVLHGVAALLALGLGGLAAFTSLPYRRTWAITGWALLLVLVAGRQAESAILANQINTGLTAAVIVVADGTVHSELIDVDKGAFVYSTHAPTRTDDAYTLRLWQSAQQRAQGETLAFVSRFPPLHAENWQERDLWQTAAHIDTGYIDEVRRYVRFYMGAMPAPEQAADVVFGGAVALVGYGVEHLPEGVAVSLLWEKASDIPQDWTWFVHVLSAEGAIIAQQDRAPLGGYAPTSTWDDESAVLDRLYLPLTSPEAPAALRVGWVAEGVLLPVTGHTTGDFWLLPISQTDLSQSAR